MANLVAETLPLELIEKRIESSPVLAIDRVYPPFQDGLIAREFGGNLREFPPFPDGHLVQRTDWLPAQLGAYKNAVFAAKPAANQPAALEQPDSRQFGLKCRGICRAKSLDGAGECGFIAGEFTDRFTGFLQLGQAALFGQSIFTVHLDPPLDCVAGDAFQSTIPATMSVLASWVSEVYTWNIIFPKK
jgi:hypothetical protein